MSNGLMGSVARAAVLVAANLLLCIGNAHAGSIFHGTFDPSLYGGTVNVDILNPGCILTNGWIAAGTGAGECGEVDVTSLFVQNPNTGPATDTLTFAPPTILDAVTGLWWVNGVLTAIDSNDMFTDGNGADAPFFTQATYRITFESGHVNNPDVAGPSDVLLVACSNFGCDGGDQTMVGDEAATQHPFIEVSVPEPGSIALMLGGLAAGWLTRRRRILTH